MKRLLFAAVLALAASPALAQSTENPYQKQITEEKRRDAEEAEKSYKAMMKQLPDRAPQKVDPWGGVRDAEPTSATTAKPKKKPH